MRPVYFSHFWVRGLRRIVCVSLLLVPAALVAFEIPVRDTNDSLAGLKTGRLFFQEDPGAQSDLEVIRIQESEWIRHPLTFPTFGYSESAFWFRFTVQNETNQDLDTVLFIDNEYLNQLEVYGVAGDAFVFRKKTGRDLPFFEREIPRQKFAFRLGFPAGAATTVYLRAYSRNTLNFPIALLDERRYGIESGREQLRMGIYFTSFVVLFILNSVFFYVFRERSLLFYLAYLFSNFLFQFSLHGLAFEYLWPDSPVWNRHFNMFGLMSMLICAMFFAKEFLRSRLHMPIADRIVNVMIAVAFCICPLMLVFPMGLLEEFLSVSLTPACIIMSIYLGARALALGYRPALFYLLAWTLFVLGTVVYLCQRYGFIPDGPFSVNMHEYLAIGSVGEMLLFTVGNAARIRTLQVAAASSKKSRGPASRVSRLGRLDLLQVGKNLKEAMEVRRVYRRDLTLSELAREISIPEKDLSEFLNERLEKTFYAYVNEYRIKEACEILRREPNKKIVAVAYDVGFHSLSTFNRAFQKEMKTSPREYRNLKQASGI